ncbi:MAG: flagella basal body P-ring formation protein FlgA [Hirschia sp.]|nr:flagella basal body P-ring formation protein FlgA [Hirschia sp.]MBF19608.1 flagella basal body P-ring formation protein FlgA [Hirschia sp.]
MKLATLCLAAACITLPFAVTSTAQAEGADAPAIVSGPWITLGDVAQASGPLADVRVAPSPAPGETLALDPAYVARIARANGVYFSDDRTAPIHVQRTSAVANAQPASFGPTAQAPAATSRALPERPSENHALVLTRDIERGEILTASDMEWAGPEDGVRVSSSAPADMADAVGMEAKRTLRAGRTFRNADIKTPSVIRKGEPVTLIYASGGLTLSVGGRALADATLGEPVRVMNNYSNRAIDALATGSGEARVAAF